MKLVRRRPLRIERLDGNSGWQVSEEVDVHRGMRQPGLHKWVEACDLGKFLTSTQDYGNGKSKALFNLLRQKCRKSFRNLRRSSKDNVATLDIGAHVAAPGADENLGQLLHGDNALSDDVDAAQQCDVGFYLLHDVPLFQLMVLPSGLMVPPICWPDQLVVM